MERLRLHRPAAPRVHADDRGRALARHAARGGHTPSPHAHAPAPKGRTLSESLGGLVGWLATLAAGTAGSAGQGLSFAWAWCLTKVNALLSGAWMLCKSAAGGALMVWSDRRLCLAALGGGVGAGVIAWLAGPLASSALCALAGAAAAVAATLLAPFWGAASGD